MQTRVYPSVMGGKVQAPASKSHTQRGLLAGLLSRGTSELVRPGLSEDEQHMLGMITNLGAQVTQAADRWLIQGGKMRVPASHKLDAGESGLGMRLIIPVACLLDQTIAVTGGGSLTNRPMGAFENLLRQAGGWCHTQNGYPPVRVKGPLTGGNIGLDGALGSQFLSGLLFALPLASGDSTIAVDQLKSTPYIDMSLNVLEHFGIEVYHRDYKNFEIRGQQSYRPTTLHIEGDWSNAAFLMAGAAINGRIQLWGLHPQSPQADRRILEALEKAGVPCSFDGGYFTVQSPASLQAFDFDATHCPDLFPPLAALAAYANGVSSIRGVHRLRHKESNRAVTLVKILTDNGIQAACEKDDVLKITGGTPQGSPVNSHGDHRMAMAAAILALKAQNPLLIKQSQAVKKSFPGFFETINQLNIKTDQPQ